MAGAWRRVTADLAATFQVEGCLDSEELNTLSGELRAAADAGYRHLILDLHKSCEQSVQQWSAFRPVMEELTRSGARLSVEGADPDLRDGLHTACIEAQLRWLEKQQPDFFSKRL